MADEGWLAGQLSQIQGGLGRIEAIATATRDVTKDHETRIRAIEESGATEKWTDDRISEKIFPISQDIADIKRDVSETKGTVTAIDGRLKSIEGKKDIGAGIWANVTSAAKQLQTYIVAGLGAATAAGIIALWNTWINSH